LIGNRENKPFKLAGITVPQPVFFCSVEPPSVSAQGALDHALACIQRDDPSVQISNDKDTGQTLVAGMGELHMEIIHFKLVNEFKVAAEMGRMRVSYREAASTSFKLRHVHQTPAGARTIPTALSIEITPLGEDVTNNEIVIATQLPPATYDAVIAGLEDALNRYFIRCSCLLTG
jgi:elongation factor G